MQADQRPAYCQPNKNSKQRGSWRRQSASQWRPSNCAARAQDAGHFQRVGGILGQGVRAVGFFFAPAQVKAGVGRQDGAAQIGSQIAHAQPHRRRQAGRLAEHLRVHRRGVQAHQPAHAGPADGRVFAPGQGGELRVDVRLEFLHEPLQVLLAGAVDAAEPVGVIGAVFLQAHVALVVAFRRGDDGVGVGVQVFLQAPAGAVGGSGIKKQVVAVEHIHDRVAPAGSLPAVRQVQKDVAVQPVGRDVGGKGLDHAAGCSFLQYGPLGSSIVPHRAAFCKRPGGKHKTRPPGGVGAQKK